MFGCCQPEEDFVHGPDQPHPVTANKRTRYDGASHDDLDATRPVTQSYHDEEFCKKKKKQHQVLLYKVAKH
jgi:hypothetical protein